MPKEFFDLPEEQSLVKATIIEKYFDAWTNVMISQVKAKGGKLGYLDLFAGQGIYNDGTNSTPMKILNKALNHEYLKDKLVIILNDNNSQNCSLLDNAINQIPEINQLKIPPTVLNKEINIDTAEEFKRIQMIPSLCFLDPYGYKDLSLKLIASLIKDWGSDIICFFNYNRINAALNHPNPRIKKHMKALFEEKTEALKQIIKTLEPHDRENIVIKTFINAIKQKTGTKFIVPFRFLKKWGPRASHYLIFISKAFLGYEIMKDIMARESSNHEQGVASFEFNPMDLKHPKLLKYSYPLKELKNMLCRDFANQTIMMKEIYKKHCVGRCYILKNYQDALRELEEKGSIRTSPPAAKRRTRNGVKTFSEKVIVRFPPE